MCTLFINIVCEHGIICKSYIADNCPYTYIKKGKNTSTKIEHGKLKLMKR